MRGTWWRSFKYGASIVMVLVLGGSGVVVPLIGILFLALAAWPAVATLNRGEGWPRFLPAATLAAIVLGAYYAPVKTIDEVLALPVTLPKQVMTIGEMRDPINAGLPHPELLPRAHFYVHLDDGKSRFDDLAIRFPRTETTLREFVRTIEEQTPLRHRFNGCGNGTSILYGLYPTLLTFRAPN